MKIICYSNEMHSKSFLSFLVLRFSFDVNYSISTNNNIQIITRKFFSKRSHIPWCHFNRIRTLCTKLNRNGLVEELFKFKLLSNHHVLLRTSSDLNSKKWFLSIEITTNLISLCRWTDRFQQKILFLIYSRRIIKNGLIRSNWFVYFLKHFITILMEW